MPLPIVRRPYALFGLIVGLCVFHWITIRHQSLFVDELAELTTASESVGSLFFKPDSMPPLYSLLLHVGLWVFPSDESARFLSVIFSLLATAAVWRFAQASIGGRAGLVATLLFGLCPLQLFYAQLIRSYALMTLLAVLCIGYFIRASLAGVTCHDVGRNAFRQASPIGNAGSRRDWYLCGLAGVFGLWAHYFFALIIVTLALVWLARRQWNQWPVVISVAGMMGLFTLPLLGLLPSDFQMQHDLRDPRPLSVSALGYTWLAYHSGFALGPSQRELQSGLTLGWQLEAATWCALILIASLPIMVLAVKNLWRNSIAVILVALLCIPLVVLAWVGWQFGITYNVRFVTWMVFPYSMVLASAWMSELGGLSNRLRTTSLVLLLGLFGIANWNRIYHERYQTEDTRSAARYLDLNNEVELPIYVISDYMAQLIRYYGSDRLQVYELPVYGTQSRVIATEQEALIAKEIIMSNSPDGFWFVYSRAFHGDPKRFLIDELQTRNLEFKQRFTGIEIYRGTLAANTSPKN